MCKQNKLQVVEEQCRVEDELMDQLQSIKPSQREGQKPLALAGSINGGSSRGASQIMASHPKPIPKQDDSIRRQPVSNNKKLPPNSYQSNSQSVRSKPQSSSHQSFNLPFIGPMASQFRSQFSSLQKSLAANGIDLKATGQWAGCMVGCLGKTRLSSVKVAIGTFNLHFSLHGPIYSG